MEFPSTKQIWNIGEGGAGFVAKTDPANLQVTEQAGEDGLQFGSFVARDANLMKLFDGVFTEIAGLALSDNFASDFENSKYNLDDKVAVARRGFYYVNIDTANLPVVGGVVKLSAVAGKEGYLTSSAGLVGILSGGGVRIEAVFDTVAVVYLDGKGELAVTNA